MISLIIVFIIGFVSGSAWILSAQCDCICEEHEDELSCKNLNGLGCPVDCECDK